ncbi:hypothetical protein Trydic_g9373 [Trypoxylus dichotomus]
MYVSFSIILILLLFDKGKANIFKRIESDCQPSGVHCLSSNTFTYCTSRGGVSALLYFEFNCPRNYVCDESSKSACVRRPATPTLLSDNIITTTESKLTDRILNGLVSNSLQEQPNDVMGRVPSVQIAADDAIVNLPGAGEGSVIITPTTTTKTPPANKISRITPTNFLVSGSVIFAEDSEETSDFSIIITNGTNTGPGDSIIITPDTSSEDNSSVIITPSTPGSSGSVIITPDTTLSPGSVIITPDDGESVIITPTTTTSSPIIIVPKIEAEIKQTIILALASGERIGSAEIISQALSEDNPSIIITPTAPPPSGSVIITPDGTSPPGSVIITPGDGTGDGSIIITPDTTPSPGGVIITPTESSSSGSVIITPDTTIPPGSIIITPNNTNPSSNGSVIITPGTTTPPGGIIITPVGLPSSGSATITSGAASSVDSVIITSNNTNTGSNSNIAANPITASSDSVIVESKIAEEPLVKQSIIITPDTTASPPGSVIITPSTSTTSGSVIIVPSTTQPTITTVPPGSGSSPPNCTGLGYYWGPSCTQYYECIAVWWWYEYRLKSCDTGLWFSLANKACVTPASSECV